MEPTLTRTLVVDDIRHASSFSPLLRNIAGQDAETTTTAVYQVRMTNPDLEDAQQPYSSLTLAFATAEEVAAYHLGQRYAVSLTPCAP